MSDGNPKIRRLIGRLADPRLAVVIHRDHTILYVSPALMQVLGYVGATPSIADALDLLDEPVRAAVIADGRGCAAGEDLPLRPVALRRSIGAALPALLFQEGVALPDGLATMWLIALGLESPMAPESDDELARTQTELRLMRAALEAVPVGFTLTTEDFVFSVRNRLFESYSGFPAELLDRFKNLVDLWRFQIQRGDASKQWIAAADFTPEQIDATPPLQTILKCQTERGRYGEMSEEEVVARLDWGKLAFGPVPRADGRHWSKPQEFTRGDTGQTIESRNSPVPGIGWVQILTDVTARCRIENELRTANKTLEETVAELRAAQAQLILQEKMATLGQFTAGIAHEIKNPLNFINNFASLTVDLIGELGEQLGEPKGPAVQETLALIAKNLRIIGQHGQRTDSIVRTMLLHSRSGTAEREEVDLVALLTDACNLALHGARSSHLGTPIELLRRLPDGQVIARVVPQDIVRVVLNLLSNAFYATAKRAREMGDAGYRPQVVLSLNATETVIEISVRDNGIGMTEPVRAKLFTPFFTTKAPGEGTGLGLSLSYDVIVRGHDGELQVDTRPSGPTEFRVILPRRPRSPDPAPAVWKARDPHALH